MSQDTPIAIEELKAAVHARLGLYGLVGIRIDEELRHRNLPDRKALKLRQHDLLQRAEGLDEVLRILEGRESTVPSWLQETLDQFWPDEKWLEQELPRLIPNYQENI